jgi:hypothetical protein
MTVEYLFATSLSVADAAARRKDWRPCDRGVWLKADGTTILFISSEEQLAAVPAEVTVYEVAGASLRRRAA